MIFLQKHEKIRLIIKAFLSFIAHYIPLSVPKATDGARRASTCRIFVLPKEDDTSCCDKIIRLTKIR